MLGKRIRFTGKVIERQTNKKARSDSFFRLWFWHWVQVPQKSPANGKRALLVAKEP